MTTHPDALTPEERETLKAAKQVLGQEARVGALIERLENLTGPDRATDGQIAKAVFGWRLWRSKHGYWNVEGPKGERSETACDPYGPRFDPDTGEKNPDYDKEPESWVYEHDIPEYTASLDAALTLLPSGTLWLLSSMETGPRATVLAPNERGDYIGQRDNSALAATPAIALCIAALKATQSGAT